MKCSLNMFDHSVNIILLFIIDKRLLVFWWFLWKTRCWLAVRYWGQNCFQSYYDRSNNCTPFYGAGPADHDLYSRSQWYGNATAAGPVFFSNLSLDQDGAGYGVRCSSQRNPIYLQVHLFIFRRLDCKLCNELTNMDCSSIRCNFIVLHKKMVYCFANIAVDLTVA